MSDFLQHLVARSRDLAPPLRPRLASLFEPASLDAAPDLAVAEDIALDAPQDTLSAPELPLRAQRAAPTRSPRAPAPEEPELTQPDERPAPAPRRAWRDPLPTVAVPHEPAPPPGAAVPTSLRRPIEATQAPAPASDPLARPLVARASDPAPTPADRQAIQPAPESPAPPSGLAPVVAPPGEAAQAPIAETRTLIERIIERTTRPTELRADPAAPGSPAQPQLPRHAPDGGGAQAAPSTINVTIGRIEVRATAAQAPARQPRGTPAVMSLDEYLRRRAGGGER